MRATRTAFAMLVGFTVLMVGSIAAVPGARAQSPGPGAPLAMQRVTEGTLWWRTAGQEATPAPLLATDVDIQVTGIVVRATVRQQFTNPSTRWAEGIYVFPLPEDAAVDHLRMRVGDRVIDGVIKEREAAKKTYEAAKEAGQRASLVEQERPNVFTTSVANIAPGASISIEIEYQQVLRFDQGQLRLRFPMVVGPRYIPGGDVTAAAVPDASSAVATSGRRTAPGVGATSSGRNAWADAGASAVRTASAPGADPVPDAERITPPVRDPRLGPINPVTIQVDLAAGVPLARLESPHHPITSTALGGDRYLVTLADGIVPADRDFELVWEPVAGGVPSAAVLSETTDRAVYALVMVLPPAPTAPEPRRVAREAIFVIDTSGSMAGASIEQAKAALKLAVGRLRPTDTFNVIQFNSVTSGLFETAQPASAANLYLGSRYVDGLHADGGTEMFPALTLALSARAGRDRLRQVVFLTDGQVGNEQQLFQLIGERLGDSRLFTIGIGSAPNSHFMREAARLGRGTFTYIGSPTEVQQKMEALFRKIDAPALTDIQLELPGAVATEMFPARIPDLYLGEPILVTLRADALPTRAVLRGRVGNTPWTQEVWLQDADEGAGLSVQWARAKIAELLDQRRRGEPDDDVRAAVIEVALAHHLVSPYTSLVAVDVTPVRRSDEDLDTHELPTNLPAGQDSMAVLGLGQGATDARMRVVLGLIALALAATLAVAARLGGVPAILRRRRA